METEKMWKMRGEMQKIAGKYGQKKRHWTSALLSQAASRSQSAPHMHVLVWICSNVRQFIEQYVIHS